MTLLELGVAMPIVSAPNRIAQESELGPRRKHFWLSNFAMVCFLDMAGNNYGGSPDVKHDPRGMKFYLPLDTGEGNG